MLKTYFQFIKKRTHIFILGGILVATTLVAWNYNLINKRNNENINNLINNVFFNKTLNNIFSKFEKRFQDINHEINEGESFSKILEGYSISKIR